MRFAPVPLAFRQNIALAIHNAGESSRLTHAAPVAVAACRYFAGFDRDYWHRQPLPGEIAEIANGSFKLKEPPEIMGSGFVVRSLGAALWAFHRSDYTGTQGEHMIVVANGPKVHNLVVCTLCSCYPWPAIGELGLRTQGCVRATARGW